MVLGFIPLYFAGFLFTAGPKWLGWIRCPCLPYGPAVSASPWVVAVARRAHLHAALALAGLALACAGLAWMTVHRGRVRLSQAEDQPMPA